MYNSTSPISKRIIHSSFITAILICAVSFFTVGASTRNYSRGSTIETRYINDRVRIIGQDAKSIQGKLITYYAQGSKQWAVTNTIKVINRPVQRVIKYSKLKLIENAKAAGKWGTLKSAIVSMGYEDEWNACQYISSDHPSFITATNIVVTQGIATDAEVQAFLERSIDL